MSTTLKQEWHALKRGQAGHRFLAHYESGKRARRDASGGGDRLRRLVRLLLALGLIAVGVVLVFIPGPAILFFFVGGGLLASESRAIARGLDWTEVRVRAAWQWGKRHWQALPTWGKILVVLLAAGAGLTASLLMLRFFI